MKFTLSVLLTAAFAFILGMLFPWWSIAVAAFVVALFIPHSPAISFLAAFTAIFLLWFGYSFYLSQANGNLLASKISILILKINNPMLLITVASLVGAFVAGLAGFTGALWRKLLKRPA